MRRTYSPSRALMKKLSLLSPCSARSRDVGVMAQARKSASLTVEVSVENKTTSCACALEVVLDPGPDLFSQGPTSRVSSALVGLTSVFGMGTGVTPPLQGPRTQF